MKKNKDFILSQVLKRDWARMLAYCDLESKNLSFANLFNPRFFCVVLIRLSYGLQNSGYTRLSKFVSLINYVLNGIEYPATLEIGPGLVIPHSQGIVLGAGYIGENVTIYHQVTLGAKLIDCHFNKALRPTIEDDVVITVGAKIIGPVTIGRGTFVGANSVVLTDVPQHSLAVGVPAVIKPLVDRV